MTVQYLNKILEPYWQKGWDGSCRFDNGWADLVLELHDKITQMDPDYKILQAKEKFGLLRFYYETTLDTYDKEINDLVSEYQYKSGKICEYCGGEGRSASFGRWYKTCCEDCLVEYKNENPSKDCKFVPELKKPIILEK
jgi:hypothetical protein